MKDVIVERIIEEFQERSKGGIKKYGTTLQDNNKDDFLQHLKEELMDAVLYIEKLQSLSISKYAYLSYFASHAYTFILSIFN